MVDTALAKQVVQRQLCSRGALNESNISTILINNGIRQVGPAMLQELLRSFKNVVTRLASGDWIMTEEKSIIYSARKPGGINTKTWGSQTKTFFRQHADRILHDNGFEIVDKTVLRSKHDACNGTTRSDIPTQARPVESVNASKKTLEMLRTGEAICVTTKIWAVPAGPSFSEKMSARWKSSILAGAAKEKVGSASKKPRRRVKGTRRAR